MGIDILTLAAARAGKGSGGSASKYKQPDWGSEVAEVEILPQTSFGADDAINGMYDLTSPALKSIEVGKEYIVNFNGTKYTCTAQMGAFPWGDSIFIGNSAGTQLEDNDEPFTVVIPPDELVSDGRFPQGIVGLNDSTITAFTISIKAVDKVYHKIPGEYVGGVGKYKQPEWGAEEVVLLPETELAFAMNDDLGMDCAFVELSQALAADASYAISFNGTVYNCKSIAADDGSIIVGNATALGGAGNDEPFMLLDMGGMNIVVPLDGSTSATMSVARSDVHEIPASYLGAKDPLIVTVVNPIFGGGYNCSETAASIYAAVKSGRLVYLDIDTGMQYTDELLPLMNATDSTARFGKFYINPNDISLHTYDIDKDGVLTVSYGKAARIASDS